MCQDHEDKKHLKRHRRHGEEIEGHQVPHAVFQEGLPRGRGWLPWARAVLFHRGFRHNDPELAQLAHDAWGPPCGVRLPHGADQVTYVLSDGRTPRCPASSTISEKATPKTGDRSV